ncbi:MAG: hypothetical protein IJW49_09020 [Clostridia bacterium]|nr:hypothetical protein [Clostridia bacterium]
MRKGFWHRKKDDPINPEMPQNQHYEAISARLGILQVLLYLSLFAFVVLAFISNTELITYRNFYYFFKDLNTSFESISMYSEDSVSYSTSDEQSFVVYRNGLAVAGNTSVTVFTETGRQTLSQTISYKNPIAEGAGKFLLVYELGGTNFSLYNSNAQLYTGTSDFPIRDAAVSDSGMFAIVSSSEEYTSVVSLYSSNFFLINRYNKNGYVMDVDIDADGGEIAILTSIPQEGLFHTDLLLHQPGTDGEGITVSIGNSLALQCAYTETGGVSVLCSNGFSFVKDGRSASFYDFNERSIISADLGPDGLAVCLRSTAVSNKNDLIVFDKDGVLVYNESAPVLTQQMVRSGESVFLLHTEGITRLDLSDGTSSLHVCTTENRVLLAQNDNAVLLCSPQKAVFLKI